MLETQNIRRNRFVELFPFARVIVNFPHREQPFGGEKEKSEKKKRRKKGKQQQKKKKRLNQIYLYRVTPKQSGISVTAELL